MYTEPLVIPCPFCNRPNDTRTSMDPDHLTPKEGDVAMCIACGRFSMFSKEGLIPAEPSVICELDPLSLSKATKIHKRFLAKNNN